MSKDGTNRGGPRPGSGRKAKAVSEKLANGNPGGRKLSVIDFGNEAVKLDGADMPPVKEYLRKKQKDGSVTCAEEIFKETWEWLRGWVQCEEAVSDYGFLAKKPTGTVVSSPYVTMGREYMKQANAAWYQIFQIVKENCSVELSGPTPQDDVMERLLRAREGRRF